MMFKIRNLTRSFGERNVLDGISFDFPDRGLVSIVGPSGCGKTTFLNILSCIDQNASGEVLFNGNNLLKFSKQEAFDYRLHQIGYVFQSFNLIPLETGERNVSLVLDSATNISKSFRKRKIRRKERRRGYFS